MDDLIKYIQALCEQIAQENANAEDIAKSLGNVQEQVFQSILVAPAHDEWLSGITVNKNASDDDVNHIQLQLSESLKLDELVDMFGEYKKQRGGSKAPAQAMFGIQAKSETHTATVMATMNKNNTDQITIRRDIRLI